MQWPAELSLHPGAGVSFWEMGVVVGHWAASAAHPQALHAVQTNGCPGVFVVDECEAGSADGQTVRFGLTGVVVGHLPASAAYPQARYGVLVDGGRGFFLVRPDHLGWLDASN